jgi:hypothetical protein
MTEPNEMTDAEAATWNELTPREMAFVSPEAVKAVLRAQAAAVSRAQYVAELDKRLNAPVRDKEATGYWISVPGGVKHVEAAATPSDKQEADRRDAIYRKALAMGDAPDTIGPDTHEHHFEVDPASGIELCTYCRLSRVAAKKAAPLAQSAEQDRIDALEEALRLALAFIDDAQITDGQWHWLDEVRPVLSKGASK